MTERPRRKHLGTRRTVPMAIAARLTSSGSICTRGTAPCLAAATAKLVRNGSSHPL